MNFLEKETYFVRKIFRQLVIIFVLLFFINPVTVSAQELKVAVEGESVWEHEYTYIEKKVASSKVKKGYTFKNGDIKYKITKVSTAKGEEDKGIGSLSISAANKDCKYIIAPQWVIINGKYYKIRSVAAHGFEDCKKVEFMVLPVEDIRKIGAYAFTNCEKMEYLTSGCHDKTDTVVTSKKDFERYIKAMKKKDSVAWKEGKVSLYCTYIGKKAFYNCKSLKGILTLEGKAEYTNFRYFPRIDYSCKREYGKYAFAGCKSLTELVMRTEIPIEVIPEGCFYQCDSMKIISITGEKIETKAFAGCFSLEEIYWDNTVDRKTIVEYIAEDAFPEPEKCLKLKEITFTNDQMIKGECNYEDVVVQYFMNRYNQEYNDVLFDWFWWGDVE